MSTAVSTVNPTSTTTTPKSDSQLATDAKKSLKEWIAADDKTFNDLLAQAKAEGMSPADMAKMKFQHKLEKMKSIADFISNIMKAMFDISKALIGNLRL